MSNIKEKKLMVTFVLPKEVEVETSQETQNENGDLVTIKRKEKKLVDMKFALRKPWRSLRENSEVFAAGEYGRILSGGALPAVLLEKRFNEDKGIFSKTEIDERANLYIQLLDNNKRLIEIKNTTTPDQEEIKKIEDSNVVLIQKIQKIEEKTQGLFNNSAERIVRDRTIVYYLLYLAAKEEDGKFIDYVNGDSYETRREALDVIEEDGSDFDIKVFSVFLTLLTVWLTSGKITQEDVNEIIKDIS